MAVAADGSIYAAAYANVSGSYVYALTKTLLDGSRTVVTNFGATNETTDIVLDGTYAYVTIKPTTGTNNGKIVKVDVSNGTTTDVATGLNYPRGISLYNDDLYIADQSGKIQKVAKTGGPVTTLVASGAPGMDVEVNASGIYSSDWSTKLTKYALDGTGATPILDSAVVNSQPVNAINGLVFDADNTLHFTASDGVWKLNSDNTVTRLGSMSMVRDLAFGADGTLYGSAFNLAKFPPAYSISGTPTVPGEYTIDLQVSDGIAAPVDHSYTLTVAPAAPTAPDLKVDSDTGTSDIDDLTNDTTPTFIGTTHAGATVTLVGGDGTTVLGTGTADANGAWSITSSTLTEGVQSIKAKITVVGQASPLSSALSITIDTTGPTTSLSSLGFSADSGSSTSDFNTNTAAQTINATLSGALGASEVVYGSLDNGTTWTNITTKVSGTALSWDGVTLSGSNTLKLQVRDAAGNAGTTASQAYVLDTVAPVFQSVATNADGSKVILTYDSPLWSTTAASGAFAVTIGGTAVGVTGVAVNGSTVELTLSTVALAGQAVTVAYTDPTAGEDANAVQDAAGNDAVTLAATAVDTTPIDNTPPAYQNATISGNTLTLVYGEVLKANALPVASAFTVTVNGTVVTNGISAVAINGQDNKKIDLTLANPVFFGQKVTIGYTDPTAGNDANAVQDPVGNDAASFVNYGVANTTAATSTMNIASQMAGKSVDLSIGGGLSINQPANSVAPTNLGKSIKMPLGQFSFNITGLQNGDAAQLSMTADASLKQLTYYKWNYVTSKYDNIAKGVEISKGQDGVLSTADDKAIVRFELVDGGAYDADRLANGTIVDPGGVAENKLLPVILENESAVGFVSALNPDQVSGTISYAITGGDDIGKFSVNSSTGALTFNAAPNFEAPNDLGDSATNNTYTVTVTVTGSNGGSEIQPLIVTVMNVPEAGDPTVGSNVTAVEATITLTPPPVSTPDPDTTPTQPPSTNDGDNVPSSTENQAPAVNVPGAITGDGNGDGVLDSQQSNVTSTIFRVTNFISQDPGAPQTFVTLAAAGANGSTTGTDVPVITRVEQRDAPADLPDGMSAPLGLISFTARLAAGADSGSFSLYVDPALGANGYWKQDASGTWVNLASEAYGGRMVAVGGKLRLDFVIQDGGAFDADGRADGTITDPGAMGSMPLSITDHKPIVAHDAFWF
jgi:uncharacterized repeat protein (TIGR02059 family)